MGDKYILNRDWRAMARLNIRHQLFKLSHGYLVHPSIQLGRDAAIAEIGAGTCLFPIELADELPPTVTIDAIDISLAQCPPKEYLPSNINLIAYDVYQSPPENLIGKYDFIRVQNWLCIWRDSTSTTLLDNLTRLLKPGGYLQWSEQDPTVNKIIRAPSSTAPTTATEQILGFLAKPRGDIDHRWVSRLDKILSTRFEVLSFDKHVVRDAHSVFWSVNVLQACEEFALNLEQNAVSEQDKATASRLRNGTEHAAAELLNGVGIHQELVVVVARKVLAR